MVKLLDRNSITRMVLRCKCYDTDEAKEAWKEGRNKKIRVKERVSEESERLVVGT